MIPLLVVVLGFLLPQKMIIPVKGATTADWDDHSILEGAATPSSLRK
ncbi:hypothetical protein [uncultured Aquimarina sp.]|nr:hypothetical protein [uncultured Aquimarina sp.]